MSLSFLGKLFRSQETRRTYCLEDLLMIHKTKVHNKMTQEEYTEQYSNVFDQCKEDLTPAIPPKQEQQQQNPQQEHK